MLSLIPVLMQLLQLLIAYEPMLADDVNLVIGLLQNGTDPTPDQQAQIDAALDKVNAAINAAA